MGRNAALTALVERFDVGGGGGGAEVVEKDDDWERDPEALDDEVDPVAEGLKKVEYVFLYIFFLLLSQQEKKKKMAVPLSQSPPLKRSKEHEHGTPLQRLMDLAAVEKLDPSSREFASFMDSKDALASFRGEFCIPKRPGSDAPGLYFVGNSLGLMPKATRARVNEELDAWEAKGVEGHFTGARPWAHADDFVRPQVARIVGALPEEVVVMNGLTTNLHLMMLPFYQPTRERFRIIMEKKAFPSDRYAVESQVLLHGLDPKEAIIEVGPRDNEWTLRTQDILQTIDKYKDSVALLCFSGVQYYTGQWFEMQQITAAGKRAGALVGWDLAHAAGNVPLQLHEWGVDWAVWCAYK